MRNFELRCLKAAGGVLLALASWAAYAANATDLVKFKNGEVITSADLSAYLERRVDLKATARNKWAVEKILREMALSRALVLEGSSLGEPRPPSKESERFDDAYALAIFKKLSATCAPPADNAAARKFYDEHPRIFAVPAMARLSRVMLPAAEPVEGQDASAWLMAQAQAIAGGAKNFNDVAQRAESIYRLDPQGDLGWVTLAEENTILRSLAAAKQGDMVGPVRDGDFVYLFSIVEKRESRQLAWEEVAVSVPARAVNYCRQESAKKVESDLFTKYGITLEASAINGLFAKNNPGGATAQKP